MKACSQENNCLFCNYPQRKCNWDMSCSSATNFFCSCLCKLSPLIKLSGLCHGCQLKRLDKSYFLPTQNGPSFSSICIAGKSLLCQWASGDYWLTFLSNIIRPNIFHVIKRRRKASAVQILHLCSFAQTFGSVPIQNTTETSALYPDCEILGKCQGQVSNEHKLRRRK